MAISGVSSSANTYQSHVQSNFKQRQEDFQHLTSALQSGDLTDAQTTFAANLSRLLCHFSNLH